VSGAAAYAFSSQPGAGSHVLAPVPGRLSSNKAELWAFIMAACAASPHATLWVGSDSATLVDGLQTRVGSRGQPVHLTVRQQLNLAERAEWCTAHAEVMNRAAPIVATWVPGHDPMYPANGVADTLAGRAAQQQQPQSPQARLAATWPCAVPPEVFRAQLVLDVNSPFDRGRLLEGRPRAALRALGRTCAAGLWRSSAQGALAGHVEVDAARTFGWTASRRSNRTGSSLAAAHMRNLSVRLLTRTLPVMCVRFKHLPSVYRNSLCRRCGAADESVDHLYTCPCAAEGMHAWQADVDAVFHDVEARWGGGRASWRFRALQLLSPVRQAAPVPSVVNTAGLTGDQPPRTPVSAVVQAAGAPTVPTAA
jgi:ribonuclease HI